MTRPIRREMKRSAAVEPVIGHIKAEHRMGRNYLKGRDGDRSNAVLAAGRLQLQPPPALAEEASARPYPGTLSKGTSDEVKDLRPGGQRAERGCRRTFAREPATQKMIGAGGWRMR